MLNQLWIKVPLFLQAILIMYNLPHYNLSGRRNLLISLLCLEMMPQHIHLPATLFLNDGIANMEETVKVVLENHHGLPHATGVKNVVHLKNVQKNVVLPLLNLTIQPLVRDLLSSVPVPPLNPLTSLLQQQIENLPQPDHEWKLTHLWKNWKDDRRHVEKRVARKCKLRRINDLKLKHLRGLWMLMKIMIRKMISRTKSKNF
jgi:hypothetical protein